MRDVITNLSNIMGKENIRVKCAKIWRERPEDEDEDEVIR
jgi:hypothetical protein